MCGIAGLFTQEHIRPATRVEAMCERMSYRGPDAQRVDALELGNWSGAFGHRRLAIIDLNPEGEQPMSTKDRGLTIVFNGEIYNYLAVRSELISAGHSFTTQSDTEVILRAYEHWGARCLEKLNGMFALVIHDEREQNLFIARDRLGIKPLYFYSDPNKFVFASEVRSILASGIVEPILDRESIPEYLTYGTVSSPHTLIKGIESIAPGSYGFWKNGVLEVHEYCRIEDHLGKWRTAPRTQEDLAETLDRCVNLETVSDVPLGAFLSGGIDSSAIVALMSGHGQEVNSVALVFKEADLDERQFSQSIADQFKTKHRAIEVDAETVSALVPKFAEFQDQPSIDGLNTYLVSRAAREAGLTVALSGLGGDEIFAGYPSFRKAAAWQKYGRFLKLFPDPARAVLASAFSKVSHNRSPKVERFIREVHSVEDVYDLAHEVMESKILNSDIHGSKRTSSTVRIDPSQDALDTMTALESRRYMLDTLLRQTDIMSMQHSLEVRVPLLNYEVVECALAMPPSSRLDSSVNKPLLVNALKGRLPTEVVHRKKGTFTLPYAYWLKKEFREFALDLLCSVRTTQRGLTDPTAVKDLWEGFLADKPGCTWSRVWCLCALELWCRQYIDVPVLV